MDLGFGQSEAERRPACHWHAFSTDRAGGETAGSNPVASTNEKRIIRKSGSFLCVLRMLKRQKSPRRPCTPCLTGAFLPFLQRFGNLTKDLLAGQGDAAQAVGTYV